MPDQVWWKFFGRIGFDILALFLALLPFILLSAEGAQPFQRGFFCDDESIRYPYRPETVSTQTLYLGTLLISTAIILIVEMSRYFYNYCNCSSNEPPPPPPQYRLTLNCTLPSIFFVLYRVLGTLFFGYAVTLSLTDIAKFSSGQLRPDFLDICRPDPASYNCTSSSGTSQSVYVENFRCLGTNGAALISARLGFLSRHAALSFYVAAFLLVYLQVRLTWKLTKVLRHVLQAGCYAAAFYVAISRMGDNAHYWTDTIAGAILGSVVGILVILYVCGILQLAYESAQAEKMLKQEIATAEVVDLHQRPYVEFRTLPSPIQEQWTAGATRPICDAPFKPVKGCSDNDWCHRRNSGLATMYSPVQLQRGMYSSGVQHI